MLDSLTPSHDPGPLPSGASPFQHKIVESELAEEWVCQREAQKKPLQGVWGADICGTLGVSATGAQLWEQPGDREQPGDSGQGTARGQGTA